MDLEDGVPAAGRAASLESPSHHSHDTSALARPPASLDLSRAASWQSPSHEVSTFYTPRCGYLAVLTCSAHASYLFIPLSIISQDQIAFKSVFSRYPLYFDSFQTCTTVESLQLTPLFPPPETRLAGWSPLRTTVFTSCP